MFGAKSGRRGLGTNQGDGRANDEVPVLDGRELGEAVPVVDHEAEALRCCVGGGPACDAAEVPSWWCPIVRLEGPLDRDGPDRSEAARGGGLCPWRSQAC